jgi:predicted ATPase
MGPIIRKLRLKGFRSIAADEIEFDNPTFLVGRNGSGKTNLIDAISFLAEAMVSPLETVIAHQGGLSEVCHRLPGGRSSGALVIAVDLGLLRPDLVSGSYSFEIHVLPGDDFEVVREVCRILDDKGQEKGFSWHPGQVPRMTSSLPGLSRMDPPFGSKSLLLPVFGGHEDLAPLAQVLRGMRTYSIDPAKLREVQDADPGIELRLDGSNAASVLETIERRSPETLARIGDLLTAALPHDICVKPVRYGRKLSVEFVQHWGDNQQITFNASSMSDGTLRALGILTAVFQEPLPSLIVLEEPEATIHPGALGLIIDLLQFASERTQVIVTTHSPELLEAKWIEDRHLRIVSWEDGATFISPIADGARKALQEHLMGAGELLRSDALDSPPLQRSHVAGF